MNYYQMKYEGDPKRGKLENINLDIFDRNKYLGSIWRGEAHVGFPKQATIEFPN